MGLLVKSSCVLSVACALLAAACSFGVDLGPFFTDAAGDGGDPREASVLEDTGAPDASAPDAAVQDARADSGDAQVGCLGPGNLTGGSCGRSCAAVLAVDPNAKSGVYLLDPDGPAPKPAFAAYCSMDLFGGGFTLAMKMDGARDTFRYDSPLWVSNSTFQEQNADLDGNEAKLAAFSNVSFSTILVGLRDETALRWLRLSYDAPSLESVFSPGAYAATNGGRAAWLLLLPDALLQGNCNCEGFNLSAPGNTLRVRLGLLGNNEAQCDTPDSWIGVGSNAAGASGKIWAGNVAAVDIAYRAIPAFAYILVR
jgi:hypothetical protein